MQLSCLFRFEIDMKQEITGLKHIKHMIFSKSICFIMLERMVESYESDRNNRGRWRGKSTVRLIL